LPTSAPGPGPGLTPATSAPGPGSPLPHLHRDRAHPCRICTATASPAGGEAVRRDGRRAARLRPRRDPARVLQELLGEPLCDLISARTTCAAAAAAGRIALTPRRIDAGATDTARPAVRRIQDTTVHRSALGTEGMQAKPPGVGRDRARRGERPLLTTVISTLTTVISTLIAVISTLTTVISTLTTVISTLTTVISTLTTVISTLINARHR
jgi:hypothetical protein